MASRKRNNIPGAAEQTLRTVKNSIDAAQYAVKSGKDKAGYDEIVKCIAAEIRESQSDIGGYNEQLLSKSIDNILDRIVWELDQRQQSSSFTDSELASIKEQVVQALSDAQSETSDNGNEKTLDSLQQIQEFLSQSKQNEEQQIDEAQSGDTTGVIASMDDSFEQLTQFQKYVVASVSALQSNIKLMGASLKNHYLFNYKNPFIQQVSKIKDPFIEINKKLDSIQNSMKWSMIFSICGFFVNVFKKFGGVLAKLSKGLIGKISKFGKGLWQKTSKVFSSVFSGIKGLGSKMWGGLKAIGGKFKGIGAGIKGLGSKMWGGLKAIGGKFKGIGAGIKGLGSKMWGGLKGFGSGLWNKIKSPFVKSAKDKKTEKENKSIFGFLGKALKKVKAIFSNIGNFVVGLIASIIIPIMKLIAKCISILFKPFLTFLLGAIWGTGIGFVLIAIAIAVPLIAIAIKEFVEWLRDDVWPTIDDFISKLEPETINHALEAVSGFLDTLTAILNALFAPLVLIGTAIKGALDPLCDFVRNTLYSIVNAMKPVIDKVCQIISGAILGILNGIDPLIKAIEPIVRTLSEIISGTVLMLLNGIKFIMDLIQPIIEAMKPLLDIIKDIIVGTIQVAVEGIKIVVDWVKEKVQYIRDHWDEIVAFIKSIPGKIWNFICKLPGMIWGLIKKIPSMVVSIFKKVLDIGKFVLNKIKGAAAPLADKGFSLFGKEFKPFSFLKGASDGGGEDIENAQPEVEVDMPDVDMTQPETINKITQAEPKTDQDANDRWLKLDKKQDMIMDTIQPIIPFLQDAIQTIEKNFDMISKKLNDPQVMPLPIPNRNAGFMTENR